MSSERDRIRATLRGYQGALEAYLEKVAPAGDRIRKRVSAAFEEGWRAGVLEAWGAGREGRSAEPAENAVEEHPDTGPALEESEAEGGAGGHNPL